MVFQAGNHQASKGSREPSLTNIQSRLDRKSASKGIKSNSTELAGHCEQDTLLQTAVKVKLREKLRENLRSIFNFEPHKEQLDAISHLIHDKGDLILIARTGWGKSVIFHRLLFLYPTVFA
jgi:superfamily II DNA or RNA helicase